VSPQVLSNSCPRDMEKAARQDSMGGRGSSGRSSLVSAFHDGERRKMSGFSTAGGKFLSIVRRSYESLNPVTVTLLSLL
jgi:hypothetical protein